MTRAWCRLARRSYKAHTGTVGGWRGNFEVNNDSPVIIVTRLRAGSPKNQISIAYRGRDLCQLQRVQTGCGASPYWGLFRCGQIARA